MTEYELVDAIASLNSNLVQGEAVTISLLSAYMIVAYTVGADLTRFQVMFISLLFVIFGVVGLGEQNYLMNEFLNYSMQLNELRGALPRAELVSLVSKSTILGLRILMIGGALYFMWRVRHPKPNDRNESNPVISP